MNRITRASIGALLMLASFAGLTSAHHIIDVSASVTCEGYLVSWSANVFGGHRIVVTVNGSVIEDQVVASQNPAYIVSGTADGQETAADITVTLYKPNGKVEDTASDSAELDEPCATPTPTPEVTPTPTPEVTPSPTPSSPPRSNPPATEPPTPTLPPTDTVSEATAQTSLALVGVAAALVLFAVVFSWASRYLARRSR
jgi:hypothetical protein